MTTSHFTVGGKYRLLTLCNRSRAALLELIHFKVSSAQGHQLVMGTLFHNFAAVKDQNLIGAADRG